MQAGALISEARGRAGITQTELAARMGTHQSVVARWETGKTQPTLETVGKAVSAAGLTLEVSIGGPARGPTPTRQPRDDLAEEMRRLNQEQARLRWIKAR